VAAVVIALAEAKQPWFWEITGGVAAALVVLNVAALVAVHARRVRQSLRGRRERAFRARIEEALAELDATSATRDPEWLGAQIRRFDELQRPIAATMLIERIEPASEVERAHALEVLRQAGAIDALVRSTGRRMPWRRALAIRTLGWIGADEAVLVLMDKVSDRSRSVRETAVRALARIGDARAVPLLAGLFRAPGTVGGGVVYDALVSFGPTVAPVFSGALQSGIESVRVASCFGVAAVSPPEDARRVLEPLLADATAPVRAAAAESLGQVGGGQVPEGLVRASRDEQAAVRSAAVGALGFFDDPSSVELASNALLDPDRDTAVRAGEALVQLSRRPVAGPVATEALRRAKTAWPVERALTYASLGAV
jgi:HEAT repeat protein